ncbi:hypothetical protein TNCV_2172801 [Trichonephila clavipes]|nr:hypothetical protein TNCV_2172801 [Trichonephila clavipes]
MTLKTRSKNRVVNQLFCLIYEQQIFLSNPVANFEEESLHQSLVLQEIHMSYRLYLPDLRFRISWFVLGFGWFVLGFVNFLGWDTRFLQSSEMSAISLACSVLETTTTTSNTITTISPDTPHTSKPRRKKRPPKNQSNTIKPKIEIKTTPHRSLKPALTEYSTDEEDMIVYDVWKMNLS